MKRQSQAGFSLVELMIAITLASITAIVVLSVLSNYQKRSTSLVGRNDAQISAAVGLYAVEKEVRMAGAGLTTPDGRLCGQGVNIAYAGVVKANGSPLMPLRIIDGDSGPDSIEIIRSDSSFGAAPTRLVSAMVSSIAQLSVDGKAGFTAGDLMMVGAPDGSKICTLMGVTGTTANGSGWLLGHVSGEEGAAIFNPDPTVFTNAIAYDMRDVAVNLGRYGIRRYAVVCDGGAAPSASNNCDMGYYNPLQFDASGITLADISSIAPQIIDMQAQYGVAPAGSQQVNEWVDATAGSAWETPTAANLARIKAVRIAIVARANQDGTDVAPPSITLWDGPCNGAANCARGLTTAERRFRYQVLTVVIPLINSIWAGA